jgi:hypothetical protein
MTDAPEFGDPVSYMLLSEGTAVACRDGTDVGSVNTVIADEDDDIFDGIVVDSPAGPRFVEADMVDEIRERRVMLKIAGDEVPGLPNPHGGPGEFKLDADAEDPHLLTRLSRAFEGRFGDLWKRD